MDGNVMKVKVTAQQHNPLLKRKEVTFEAAHELHEGTPTRTELRKNLAEILKANIDLIFIERAVTKTGSTLTVGEAHVYDTPEQVKIEAEHIITRNIPPAKPKEGEEIVPPKEEAPKPKEEAAKPKEEGAEKPKEA